MRSLSDADLRAIGRSLMADPEMRRVIVHEIFGGTLPITGGTCSTPASEVSSGNFGAACSDTGTYAFPAKVGIGTTSPQGILHINAGSSDVVGNKVLFASGSNSYGQVQLGGLSTTEVSLSYIANVTAFGDPPTSSSGSSYVWNQGIGLYSTLASQYCIANTAYGGPIFLVDSAGGVAIGTYAANAADVPPPDNGLIVSGSVGIGTDAPFIDLDIEPNPDNDFQGVFVNLGGLGTTIAKNNITDSWGNAAFQAQVSSGYTYNGANFIGLNGVCPAMDYYTSNSTDGDTQAAVTDGVQTYWLYLSADDGVTETGINGAALNAFVDGTVSEGIVPMQWTFHVQNQAGAMIQPLTIRSSGNVGIGTTTPAAKLHVGGTPGTDGIMFPDGSLQKTAAVAGSGTTNRSARFSGASTLANGALFDDSTHVAVGEVDGSFPDLSTLTVIGNSPTVITGTTLSITAGLATVSGTLTTFETQVAVGDLIVFTVSGTTYTRTVVTITGNTSLTVDEPYTVTAGDITSWTDVPSILKLEDDSGNVQFIVDNNGFIAFAGSPPDNPTTVNDNEVAGYVACKLDHTFTDPNQEMRGYQSTVRYTRSTADGDIGGDGWDVFGYAGAVSLENMHLPTDDPNIRGAMKPFQSELYFGKPASGGPAYTIGSTYNYVASLSECDPGVSVTLEWTGLFVGEPNGGIQPWTSGNVFEGAIVIPSAISYSAGSGYMWIATAFSGGGKNGSTGSTEPTWPSSPTPGMTTVTDNQVTWKCYAAITTPLNSVANGYGIHVVNLQDPAGTVANPAAVKIDGLGNYGRIEWTSCSAYCPSASVLEFSATPSESNPNPAVQTASGVPFNVGGSGGNAICNAGGFQVGGAAATAGYYLRGNGTSFVGDAVQAADLPVASATASGIVNTSAQSFAGLKAFAGGIDGSGGSAGVRIRNFDQPTPPSLNANEIAFWFAPTGTYAGMGGLLFYDATNYWWFAASASLTVTALVNP